MGFLGLGRKNDKQNGPLPISSNPFLRRYLETDPEMQQLLDGHSTQDLVFVRGPGYSWAINVYSIEDSTQRLFELGELRENEYRLIKRR